MEYILLLNNQEKRWSAMTDAEAQRESGAYLAYAEALREAGAFVGGNRLEPTTLATTVRVTADGKTTVLDGPYADTKEQLGGYFVIDVPDLDAAIAWAARCPCASHGTVEVRPIGAVPARA
ncbi:MAG: YciI family protein [Vulcanimicrobiaceae bacterium]